MRFLKTVFLLLLIVLLAPTAVMSQSDSPLTGRIVRVSDGDTVWLETAGRFEWIKVRFYGVDAPETKWPEVWPAQPFSAEAKKFVIEQAAGKQVSVQVKDHDIHGRTVGEVFIDSRSLSRELLRRGLAWWNRKYAPDDLDFKHLEAEARRNKLGLWSQKTPVPPWEHRYSHKVK